VNIGAVGHTQPEQCLEGVLAQIHYDFIGVAQSIEHHMEQIEEMFVVETIVFVVVFLRQLILVQNSLLDAVEELFDIDRLIGVDGDTTVANMLFGETDGFVIPCFFRQGVLSFRCVGIFLVSIF
jgi:hypothetical protein